jgi:hypothetical protein
MAGMSYNPQPQQQQPQQQQWGMPYGQQMYGWWNNQQQPYQPYSWPGQGQNQLKPVSASWANMGQQPQAQAQAQPVQQASPQPQADPYQDWLLKFNQGQQAQQALSPSQMTPKIDAQGNRIQARSF